MARCEECLHFEVCEALEQGNGIMKVSPIYCAYYKPTADVVPKSEVDRLTVELEAMRTAANSYKMHYENLAREIFEEIEDFIKKQHNYMDELYFNSDDEVIQVYYGCKIGTYNHIKNFIEKLKKKYTEGG